MSEDAGPELVESDVVLLVLRLPWMPEPSGTLLFPRGIGARPAWSAVWTPLQGVPLLPVQVFSSVNEVQP